MPGILTKREEPCSACGGRIRRGEYAYFTSELGAQHLEPTCAGKPARYRPNGRAGTCTRCGTHVPAGKGLLALKGEQSWGESFKKSWSVTCAEPCG